MFIKLLIVIAILAMSMAAKANSDANYYERNLLYIAIKRCCVENGGIYYSQYGRTNCNDGTSLQLCPLAALNEYNKMHNSTKTIDGCKKDKRGCCSHHKGVKECVDGRLLCNDDTFSPTC